MWPIIGVVVGGLAGGLIGDRFETAAVGAFVGFFVGLILRQRRAAPPATAVAATAAPVPGIAAPGLIPTAADARIDALERRLAQVEGALARAGLALPAAFTPLLPTAVAVAPLPAPDVVPGAGPAPRPAAPRAPDGTMAMPPSPAGRAVDADADADAHTDTATPVYLAPSPAKPNFVWAWLTGGNTLARVGIVLLFIGVGFLLKYAAEHVTVPLELRIAGVALGGVALLVLGWWLRERRTAYAMILQGGGVGVLYLTVFAALKLYALVPAPAAFGLLVAIAAFSAVLAVKQDSLALAAIGVIGGFAAPILTSSGSGSHVVLFAYYALLNAGIFGIAWFKAWRLLNLLGFVCTFIVGTAWGVTRYRSGDFATTEPFLVLFFLFYVGIAVLYALKRSVEVRHYVDGTIVFGTPLVAAGLQQALVRPYEFGMAISAVAMSALYLLLARVLWATRREDLRLLTESFLALGVVFATLAVPLAVDARWTSATWALEGAAIIWVGVRQGRVAARAFGLLLQVAAGVAYALGGTMLVRHAPEAAWPLANREFLGGLLVALGGLATALVYHRGAAMVTPTERAVTPVAFAWGVLWWLFAGANEIDRFVAPPRQPAALAAFAALTAVAFAAAARRLAWPMARVPALLLGVALLAGALLGAMAGLGFDWHLFGHGGFLAWPFAIAVYALLLLRFEREGAYPADGWVMRAAHAVLLWLVALVVAHELAWLVADKVARDAIWRVIPWGIVPALALALACYLAGRGRWPAAAHSRAYLVVGAVPLVLWMLVWGFVVGIASDGDPAPLPYLPVVNPVDLTLGAIAVVLTVWVRALAREGVDVRTLAPREAVIGVPAVLAFLWMNAIALRTLHHWFGIAWAPDAMWSSTLVQAVLSILWAVIALATMVVANRMASRTGWIAGAALLAVVVVKLFLVDLSRIGGIERIVSFIGVGLLLLLIGYLAPVPANRKEPAR